MLDCGASGAEPPLALFYRYRYRTYGLEIAEEQLAKARRYCREQCLPLNIFRGDMRSVPFASGRFSFVYSLDAIFFMTKPGIAVAMGEIERVLKPGGLRFVNFRSVDDPDRRPFCATAPARRLLGSEGFSYHEDDEADAYFQNFRILRKEKRIIDKVHGRGRLVEAYVEYIAEKL